MRIFSNFDTQLEKDLYAQAVAEHGERNVRIVHRDPIFFLLRILIPGFIYFFLVIVALLLPLFLGIEDGLMLGIVYVVIGILFLFSLFGVGSRIIKDYIDYKMDFTLITPCDIKAFNQSGFFGRNQRVIDVSKIKTVTADKAGIIKSFFNYGTIKVLTEGDDENGDIMLYYVSDPDFIASEISRITKFATEGGGGVD